MRFGAENDPKIDEGDRQSATESRKWWRTAADSPRRRVDPVDLGPRRMKKISQTGRFELIQAR
jgi:hypothetical protein